MMYDIKKLNSMDKKARGTLLLSTIVPRPIGVVTTMNAKYKDKRGDTNIAPFSLFNFISTNPVVVYISVKKAKPLKKTSINIKKFKEFVVNIPNYEIAEKINKTSLPFPLNMQDKFEMTGLTKVKSTKIKTCGIKECLIRFECKLIKIINFEGYEVFLGKVVNIFCDDSILENDVVSHTKYKFIAKLGPKDVYLNVKDTFEIKRIE